jgi:hypothetical protein
VCPALIARKLLIKINLQLINIFINFHKFTNFEKFSVSTAMILLFLLHIQCEVMSQIPAKKQRNQNTKRLRIFFLFLLRKCGFLHCFRARYSDDLRCYGPNKQKFLSIKDRYRMASVTGVRMITI